MTKGADARTLKARHPLCPYCGHDLVTTVANRSRICPECGEEFEPHDLRYERRTGDWTMMQALRMAGRTLIVRSLAALVAVVTLTSLMIVLAGVGAPRIVFLAITLTELAVVGMLYSRKLWEHIGFESVIIIVITCLAAFFIVGIGQSAAFLFFLKVPPMAFGLHAFMVIFGSWTWIIYTLIADSL